MPGRWPSSTTPTTELNGAMRRTAYLTLLALVVSACALLDGTNTSGETASTGSVPPASPPASTASTEGRTSTTLSDCTGADSSILLLCEAVDLIQRRYVDQVADEALIAPAVEAVQELPGGGAEGDLGCDIDDDVAQPICREIDRADVAPIAGVETALSAMAFSLDPNSAYLDQTALALLEQETSGQVEGIGALVNAEDSAATDPLDAQCSVMSATCRLVVISTFAGSPAQQAGLLPGDEFVTVDGVPIDGMHIDEVTQLVRGPAGSEVTLGMLRDEETLQFEIVRESVDIPIAEWQMVGDIGYMRFNLFTSNADDQVRRGLTELLDAGARGIVFDLRDNPGGSLQAAVEVTSEFLEDGLVVRTESPEAETTFEVTGEGVATDPSLPLWVVVNEGSASASEVMAGVLKESGRATVLGHNTFGKNTVQQRFALGNGGALKLTVARWVTPAGEDFGTVGISPDIRSEFPFDMTPEQVVARVLELTG